MTFIVKATSAVATLGALLCGLVVAEASFPVGSKPSILLRASTGALPTADLQGALTDEEARLDAARKTAEQVRAQAAELKAVNAAMTQATRALDARIQEKQIDWSAGVALPSP